MTIYEKSLKVHTNKPKNIVENKLLNQKNNNKSTDIAILARLINALKITNRNINDIKVVINKIDDIGYSTIKLLNSFGIKNIIAIDEIGILNYKVEYSNKRFKEIGRITNRDNIVGSLSDALMNADVFINNSNRDNNLKNLSSLMKPSPIIFLLNLNSETIYDNLINEKDKIIYTNLSSYPNQINLPNDFLDKFNNYLAFTDDTKIAYANEIAISISNKNLSETLIL